MKGLELAEEYFREYGEPMIKEAFPALQDRIAAGLVGDGSECFGFDDEISRDHDWGPGFCLWLTVEDFDKAGPQLAQEVARLPQTFAGFGPRICSQWGNCRVGVFEIAAFYSNFIGFETIPNHPDEWLSIPESSLAACINGKVFRDPLGEFSSWRSRLLQFYPEDVRLKKIASRCMTIGQSGQYNLDRCLKRGDRFAAQYTETKFCADAISLLFLLNRTYTPFFKWMHRSLKGLPGKGEWFHSRIFELVSSHDPREKLVLVGRICNALVGELRRQGLTDSSSRFLLDHGPIVHSRISDPALSRRNVWVG